MTEAQKAAARRRAKPKRYELHHDYVQLSDAVVLRLCKHIRVGLSGTDAAAIEGVSASSFRTACTGSNPTHPAWAEIVARAQADCRLFWWRKLARTRRGAEVRACAHALTALDDRFQQALAAGGGRILVYLQAGPGESGSVIDVSAARPRVELPPERSEPGQTG
jgi:hypothetical protein